MIKLIYNIKHGKLKLTNLKFYPYWLVFMVLVGILHLTGKKKKKQDKPVWEWHKCYGSDQPLFWKAQSIRWNPYLTLLRCPRIWDYTDPVTRGKPTIIALLEEHSNEMTPREILLYQYNDQCLSLPSSEKLVLAVNGIKGIQNWTMCREGETLEHSATPPQGSESYVEDREIQKWWWF